MSRNQPADPESWQPGPFLLRVNFQEMKRKQSQTHKELALQLHRTMTPDRSRHLSTVITTVKHPWRTEVQENGKCLFYIFGFMDENARENGAVAMTRESGSTCAGATWWESEVMRRRMRWEVRQNTKLGVAPRSRLLPSLARDRQCAPQQPCTGSTGQCEKRGRTRARWCVKNPRKTKINYCACSHQQWCLLWWRLWEAAAAAVDSWSVIEGDAFAAHERDPSCAVQLTAKLNSEWCSYRCAAERKRM